MAKKRPLKGKNLMLFVTGKALALATSCGIDLTANTEDAASKDSGGWDDPEVTGWAWTASSDNLCSADEADSVDVTYTRLVDLWMAGEPVDVKFGVAANASDVEVPTTGWTVPEKGYSGKAIIDSVKITAANKQNATISVSLKGKGPLDKTPKS